MSTIDELEARAAAKAIYATVRILEQEFGVQAYGSTPTDKRQSVIRKIRAKLKKFRERARSRRPKRGPVVSDLVSKIEKAAASRQGLKLDKETVQKLARVIPHGALGVRR